MLHTGLQALALLVIGWLPGALAFRAPILDRDRRAALDAEERAFWAVVISIAVSLALVLALAAVQRYSFTRLLLADAAVAAAIVARWRGRLRMRGARRLTLTALLPIALVVLGVWRFFPPAEYIIGGKDPGVYMNEGIQIAQRGALVVRDDTIAAVPAFARDLFFPRYRDLEGEQRSDYYSVRFMGFFILDPDSGAVVGQFPHLFPASIALGYGLHGLTGARMTTGVWAMLGLVAVYFAGARLLGKPAAGAAAALLACNVAQTWFGRYPNAEIAMQALLFAALLAFARAQVDDIRFFGPIAGGLLGLMLFLRLDAALAIAGIAGAAGLGLAAGQRLRPSFWIALAIPAVLAVAYLAGPMRPYADIYRTFLTHLSTWQYLALGAAAAVAAIVILSAFRGAATGVPRSGPVLAIVPSLLAGAVVGAGLYALFLRHPGGKLASHDAYALRTFANLYFTVPGVLAALLGFWLAARRWFWRDPALFLTIALFAASVFYKIRIVPEHFWMSRRFIPVVLPGALLLLSAAAFATSASGWRPRLARWAIGGTFVGLLAVSYLRVSTPVLRHTEYEGLIPKLESLSGRFGANDLVIVESRNAGGDVHVLATPLAYIYAKHVLVLASPVPDKKVLGAFIHWARENYDGVFFVGGGGTDLLSRSYGVRAVASERFEVPEFELNVTALPRPASRKIIFGVYQFVDAPAERDGWFDLDVGENDDLHVLRFNMSERANGTTFRWTAATSYVSITNLAASARELTLVLSDGGRPAAADPARVSVFLANRHLGEIEVAPGSFRSYSLAIPPAVAAQAAASDEPVTLRLISTLWNPHEVLGTGDSRNLGVMLDRVTVK